MEKSKTRTSVIWILCFALSLFLLLVIPDTYSQTIWVTLIFDVIAFVSQYVLWGRVFNKIEKPQGIFNRYPIMTISCLYLGIEMILCIVTALMVYSMTIKTSLIVNFVIMVAAWVIILMLLSSKDHVERLDSRQRDNHVEL